MKSVLLKLSQEVLPNLDLRVSHKTVTHLSLFTDAQLPGPLPSIPTLGKIRAYSKPRCATSTAQRAATIGDRVPEKVKCECPVSGVCVLGG